MPTFGVVYITENALFGVDSTIISIKIAILLGSMAILVMSLSSYSAQGNQVCFLNKKQSPGFEFTQLVLLSTLGMLLLISSKDLISLYLSIELISLSLYILASINREGQFSTEAGIKYFLLGSVASGVLLLGSTLIY
jgi:NADH-quinone oxidoreductase subunit N